MLIQWGDGQQTFQNAYYIFTSKDLVGMSMRDEREINELEMNMKKNRTWEEKESLVEYEEDKYETKLVWVKINIWVIILEK